jgi:hypothetical protein
MDDIVQDDGSVMCVEHQLCCWIFSTIRTPSSDDGSHPVSGNRMFGFTENTNGTYTIFTKGFDRARFPLVLSLGGFASGNTSYDAGSNLWDSFLDKIEGYLNNNGVQNNITKDYNSNGVRPDWDEVLNFLRSSTPINEIGC